MTIKNIKKVCSELRSVCTASDPRLSSVCVEVVLNIKTGELTTSQHSDSNSYTPLDDDEIYVATYRMAKTMKEIREDVDFALYLYETDRR